MKEYVRRVRPRKPNAYLTLSFAPGENAQVDWGSFGAVPVGNTRRQLSFFVMVLSYSRLMYVEFTLSQKQEHFLQCHENAFLYFGGIPQRIMIDNLKTGVLEHKRGEPALINPRYADYARHCGFEVVACNPREPQEKGRVENGVGYVKKNFLQGLRIDDFAHLAALAEIHTRQQVAEAITDAHHFCAYSSDYIANILAQRGRPMETPGPLHLTRPSDLLELDSPAADLSIYDQQNPVE